MEEKEIQGKGKMVNKRKCVICRREFDGCGYNPVPVAFHGRCCSKCRRTVGMMRYATVI